MRSVRAVGVAVWRGVDEVLQLMHTYAKDLTCIFQVVSLTKDIRSFSFAVT